ncbi:SgrR family transcriptional regulator [Chengkuizengella sp. SCS-71B]|uniref:SgrR family transcriptional regulator n=1 Tax=Chengkuizengella sp. SCS-71B TaxID=3115290 RepID=UPI0032C24034
MKLIEHYLILHTAFKNQKSSVEIETTLNEIIDILGCSRSNAKTVLNRLDKKGWLKWKPGNGRGYRSLINFKLSLIDSIKMYANEQLAQDHFKEGMEFLQSLSIPSKIHNILGQYLEEWFGFKSEEKKKLSTSYAFLFIEISFRWIQHKSLQHTNTILLVIFLIHFFAWIPIQNSFILISFLIGIL